MTQAPTPQTVDYHLTVTLKPYLYAKTPYKQLVKSAVLLHKMLLAYKATIIAELTKDYNIHYHCLISTLVDRFDYKKRPFDYYVHDIFRRHRDTFGYIKCDQIKNYSEYVKYMMKDIDKTKEILEVTPIIRDDYFLTPHEDSLINIISYSIKGTDIINQLSEK